MPNHPDYVNESLPSMIARLTKPNCEVCLGTGLVCENHPMRPWDSGTPADCGCGAGMPCVCSGMGDVSPDVAGNRP